MKIKRLYLGLCGAVGLAGVGLWVSTAWFTYSVALTHSLPGHVYAIKRDAPVQKGDLVAFRWHGGCCVKTARTSKH